MRTARLALLALPVVAAMVAATALAGGLPRLPQDAVIPPHDGSPGAVTFSHAAHVDAQKPACTGCHPALFRILKTGRRADEPDVRHASMESGRECGACHNDKGAFGLDRCDLCHRGG